MQPNSLSGGREDAAPLRWTETALERMGGGCSSDNEKRTFSYIHAHPYQRGELRQIGLLQVLDE